MERNYLAWAPWSWDCNFLYVFIIEKVGYKSKVPENSYISCLFFKSEMSLFGSFKAMLGAGIGSAFLPDGNPLGLHLVMFQPTIAGQGTLEQQVKWLGKAWNLELIGN